MVIDVHNHLGRWAFPSADTDSAWLLERMKALGVDRSIISSSKALYYDFREGNEDLAGTLSITDGLFGYVAVNLNYKKDSIGEIEKYSGDPRFVGIKTHPMINRRALDSLTGMHIMEAAASRDLPVLVHTHSNSELESPRHLVRVLNTFPELPVIVGHSGGDDWLAAAELIPLSDNVYFEFSCSCTTPDKVLYFLEEAGEDRLLFGTDANLFVTEYSMGLLEGLGLSAGTLAKLMGLNAQKLFPFPEGVKSSENENRHVQ